MDAIVTAGGRISVTLVVTLYNEADSVDAWLASLARQTRPPDETILVDGGSEDGTLEALRDACRLDPRIRVIVAAGAGISEGRNIGFSTAKGEVVAVTDAGTVLDARWLEHLVAPFESTAGQGIAAVAGFFKPAGRTAVERVLAAVITPRVEEVQAATMLPSSRSFAVRKSWWTEVGGYPEWLRVGEDLHFSRSLRNAGAPFAFAPDAIVSWYPRPTLHDYFHQYRNYARGDGHSLMYPERQAARYVTYAGGLILAQLARRHAWARLALGGGFFLRQRRYTVRLWRHRPFRKTSSMVAATTLVPVISTLGDVAKMVGYPQGRWERWRAGGERGLRRANLGSHRDLEAMDSRRKPI